MDAAAARTDLKSAFISVPFRQPSTVDLVSAISRYVESERHVPAVQLDAFQRDVSHLASLRDAASGKTGIRPVTEQSLEDLYRYNAHLQAVAPKLPAEVDFAFVYSACFAPTTTVADAQLPGNFNNVAPDASQRLAYEQASVLFNIAAAHSQCGDAQDGNQQEGIKRSLQHQQNAAGCFEMLQNYCVAVSPMGWPPDLRKEPLEFLQALSLAQAQECVLRKSILGDLSNAVVSRIAYETSRLFASAIDRALDAQRQAGLSVPDDWSAQMRLKEGYFAAISQWRKSLDDTTANRYGIEVARLQESVRLLESALRQGRNAEAGIVRSSEAFLQQLQRSLAAAVKDNDLIYLEVVPPLAKLPRIQPASMVKPVSPLPVAAPFDCLHDRPGGFGRPLLQMLMPYTAQVAIRTYNDRKDDHLRSAIVAKVRLLDSAATNLLLDLGLPAALQVTERPLDVPPALIRASDQVRSRGGPERLEQMLLDVEKLSSRNRAILERVKRVLEHPAATISSDATVYSDQRSVELDARLQTFLGTLSAAASSDSAVKSKWIKWKDKIAILALPLESLQASIPVIAPPPDGELNQPFDIIRKLRNTLDEVEELRHMRESIVRDAGVAASMDDVRPAILRQVTKLERDGLRADQIQFTHFEDICDIEMRKYQVFEDMIHTNEAQQKSCLHHVKDLHENFLRRRSNDVDLRDRERFLQGLDAAAHRYEELADNFSEGVSFHNDFGKLAAQLEDDLKACHRIQQGQHSGTPFPANEVSGRTARAIDNALSSLNISDETSAVSVRPGVYNPQLHGPIRFSNPK